jgi:glycogen operon protein
MHVRGFTRHPSSGVAHPGTFQGLIAKIPYLKDLGVTSIELMPVAEFNPRELTLTDPGSGRRLRNYWGYSPVGFFAPAAGYAADRRPGAQVAEFKMLVRELHRAGIEVILDVVFNHTAEGDERGPTLHFKGMLNRIFYLLAEKDRRHYLNFSGCGNTVNCNHPVVRAFILDCLRYWALEMHVDGFRFDLASVLGRDQDGQLLSNPPLLEAIAEAAVLQDIKLIAEAWDAGGAYQVGSFPGTRWSEWNGRYRDDMRRFWRGDPGLAGAFATRLAGSADLYQHTGERTINSINFITSHDGFTLHDLVSYERKRNAGNGENGRDGSDHDHSANYGVEGPTADPAIVAVRRRQMKNMLATLFFSRGVPMLLGGDEFARTQRGNNNAYCQDNEISWFDWDLCAANRDLGRFVRGLIAFRANHPVLARESFYTPEELAWFDPAGAPPRWESKRAIGAHVRAGRAGGADLCLLANAGTEEVVFTVPAPPAGTGWRIAVDTAAPPPGDCAAPGARRPLAAPREARVAARALVILVAEGR